MATTFNGLGLSLRRMGNLPGAVAAYERAIALDGRYAAAYNNLGRALADQNRTAEAIQAFRNAIRHDARNSVAHSNLGSLLRAQGDYPAAANAFRQAIATGREDLWIDHTNLGLTLADQNQLAESQTAFTKALELNPRFARAHFGLGVLHTLRGDIEQATKAYQEALRHYEAEQDREWIQRTQQALRNLRG
ncbi:MAG: tetratricopeptide repeat protein [Oscillatoriales cyanobacterium SM2_2_1]|nr:tetratricopeptide repeat protein [Oscillatoriales cyanobacterium SM2_2_1]